MFCLISELYEKKIVMVLHLLFLKKENTTEPKLKYLRGELWEMLHATDQAASTNGLLDEIFSRTLLCIYIRPFISTMDALKHLTIAQAGSIQVVSKCTYAIKGTEIIFANCNWRALLYFNSLDVWSVCIFHVSGALLITYVDIAISRNNFYVP